MNRWVVEDGGVELAIVAASAGMVSVQIQTTGPITPDQADKLKNALGLAAGVARRNTGVTDG